MVAATSLGCPLVRLLSSSVVMIFSLHLLIYRLILVWNFFMLIGIGNPPGTMDMKAFLLQKFSSVERGQVNHSHA